MDDLRLTPPPDKKLEARLKFLDHESDWSDKRVRDAVREMQKRNRQGACIAELHERLNDIRALIEKARVAGKDAWDAHRAAGHVWRDGKWIWKEDV